MMVLEAIIIFLIFIAAVNLFIIFGGLENAI